MRAGSFLGHLALALTILAACCCSGPATRAEDAAPGAVHEAHGEDPHPPQGCLDAARRLLGLQAEIIRYGRLNGPEAPEAVVKLGNLATTKEGIPISRLVVLRFEAPIWKPVLDVSKQITNAAGYIGIDYIDDSYVFHGYRLVLKNQRPDGKPGITMDLSYLNGGGGVEGIPVEVAWNDKVGRYQEFAANEDPAGFKPELKSPRHIRTGERSALGENR
jgi:hypothetical protein